MGPIEKEWNVLEKQHLTSEQASDGRCCFACGALFILSKLVTNGGCFSMRKIKAYKEEISKILMLPENKNG